MRREFPTKIKVAAFEKCNGKCQKCGVKILSGAQYDHVLPDWLGGEPTIENCEVLCSPCHRIKTKKDVAMIAKAKRVRAKHIGADRPKSVMPGSKQSKWKRTLDGRTIQR